MSQNLGLIQGRTREIRCLPGEIPSEAQLLILQAREPLILKGLVRHWPLFAQAQPGLIAQPDNSTKPDKSQQPEISTAPETSAQPNHSAQPAHDFFAGDNPACDLASAQAVAAYLLSFYNGRPTQIYQGAPGLNGHYFYDESGGRLNFDCRIGQVDEVLRLLLEVFEASAPPSVYIASNLLQSHFPGLLETLALTIPKPALPFETEPDRVSIWLGNRSLAACHFDTSDNLACCVRGNRRFTLFPPEQAANLYPGPLEPTPGGQPISLVDFVNPDRARFADFAKAQAAGQIADLAPGDALFLPSMWWHQVEAPGPLNILINYWWSNAPRYTGSGMNLLHHALLCLRDKPEHERKAWQQLLDYYVFDDPAKAGRHITPAARGVLGPLDEGKARQLRAMLLSRLNR